VPSTAVVAERALAYDDAPIALPAAVRIELLFGAGRSSTTAPGTGLPL
jgi:hypothetical protein